MRAFIAISLPQEIKDSLSEIQKELKKSKADVKWVKPDNIHLTLKFLGEIPEAKSAEISKVIENIAQETNAFVLSLSTLGTFPPGRSPHIIWAGLNKGDKETKELTNRLEKNLEDLGFPLEERSFTSHITIARVKSAVNIDKLNDSLGIAKQALALKPQECLAKSLGFFKSSLTSTGPIYETLKEANLKNA